MVLECIRRELTTLLEQWLFFCILHQSLKLMPTYLRNRPGPVFRMWARRQQSRRRNTAKFYLFNIHNWFVQKLPDPELYLQCRETARYQETSPQPRWVCWGNHQRAEREHTRAWKYIETLVRCVKDDATWNSFLRIFLEFILQRILPSTGWNIHKQICWSLS